MNIPLDFIASKIKQSESYVLGLMDAGSIVDSIHARIAYELSENLAKRTEKRTLLIEYSDERLTQSDVPLGRISGMLHHDHVQWIVHRDVKQHKQYWSQQLESFAEWKSEYGLIVIRFGCLQFPFSTRATKLCDGLSLVFESENHLSKLKRNIAQWQRDQIPIVGAWSYRSQMSVAA